MALLSALLGNATEVSGQKLDDLVGSVLTPGEQIEKAYQLVRDVFIFTNWRLILVDRQGVTGKKTEFTSIPYTKITRFSMETAGSFDLDAELKIWVGSDPMPVSIDFRKSVDIRGVYALLSRLVLR
jgi:hypothetical protein